MKLPRGKLLVLVAAFMAIAMVTSTMAGLSGIMSHRTADVRVVSDYDAYLQMVPLDPGVEMNEETGEVQVVETEYDPIAYYDDLGHLALALDRVNSNSTSWFDRLFLIQNTQDEALCVWINDDIVENEQYTIGDGKFGHEAVHWYANENRPIPTLGIDGQRIDSEENCIFLAEGESVVVGVLIDSYTDHIDGGTPGLPETGTQLLQQIHVEAESFKHADNPSLSDVTVKNVFASEVLAFDQGDEKDGSPVSNKGDGVNRSDPTNALGAPDGEFVSLGFGGELTVGFGGPVYNTVGDDGMIVEITFGRLLYGDEAVEVYAVTETGDEVYLGTVTNKDDPFQVGGSTDDETKSVFQLPPHLQKFVGVKLVDVSDPTLSEFPSDADAFDVDSIRAVDP
jgi:hypothetical protein